MFSEENTGENLYDYGRGKVSYIGHKKPKLLKIIDITGLKTKNICPLRDTIF